MYTSDHEVTVSLPVDTQDECAHYERCQFLLGTYCVLFGDSCGTSDNNGHIYKLKECPASGERRYDE